MKNSFSCQDLSSYVPESLHTQGKRQKPSRVFFEDLAVIEPDRGFRILASRGRNLPVGGDFFTACGISSSDAELVRSHAPAQAGFLLPCATGCAIFFCDLTVQTGLIPCVLLSHSAEEVFCAMKRMGKDGFVVPRRILSKGELLPLRYDEALCQRLEELFYYVDRILHPAPELSLWTRSLLIANFVGCRLERVAFPVTAPPLSAENGARMTLFLICSFLTLRQKSGRVLTEGDEDSSNYQCTVSFFEERKPLAEEEDVLLESSEAPALPLFLEAPCFSSLMAIPTEDGMRLETRFPILKKEQTLGAALSKLWICLQFGIVRASSSLE